MDGMTFEDKKLRACQRFLRAYRSLLTLSQWTQRDHPKSILLVVSPYAIMEVFRQCGSPKGLSDSAIRTAISQLDADRAPDKIAPAIYRMHDIYEMHQNAHPDDFFKKLQTLAKNFPPMRVTESEKVAARAIQPDILEKHLGEFTAALADLVRLYPQREIARGHHAQRLTREEGPLAASLAR